MALLVDTAMVAPEDRFDLWSEAHPRFFFPLGVRFLAAEPFHGQIRGHRLGPLDLFGIRGDASAVRRTERAIASFDPETLTLLMALSGRFSVGQGDRHALIGRGELSSYETSRPFGVIAPGPFELLLVIVPRALLGRDGDMAGRRTARQITPTEGTGAVASSFVASLWSGLEAGTISPEDENLADALSAVVLSLHRASAGACAATAEPPAALVARMKQYIEHHLGDRDLGPERVARAHHVSTRQVHKLFAADGVSVSAWIRGRRLERCRRDLRDPRLAGTPIAGIAARWGLANHAHFTRIFRATYGETPREMRTART
jgi:AraC-like DNA-binding protein